MFRIGSVCTIISANTININISILHYFYCIFSISIRSTNTNRMDCINIRFIIFTFGVLCFIICDSTLTFCMRIITRCYIMLEVIKNLSPNRCLNSIIFLNIYISISVWLSIDPYCSGRCINT